MIVSLLIRTCDYYFYFPVELIGIYEITLIGVLTI